jgi:hypothetical protein
MNQQQGTNPCGTLFDDAGKICAARVITDQQSADILHLVTPELAFINIASVGSVIHTMNQQQGTKFMIHLFDDAGKIWCCRTAHRPAVNMLSLGCDATTCDHQHSQCSSVLQNELAAGVQNSCGTLLMMLARFALQDCSQTSSHVVSAVTPQRAIINIASRQCVTQMN